MYAWIITSYNVQFTLTQNHAGSMPLPNIPVKEIKRLLQHLCLHKYMKTTSTVDNCVSTVELALGSQVLEDNKSLNEYHVEFGERIIILVS